MDTWAEAALASTSVVGLTTVDDERLEQIRKTRDALVSIRNEIILMHRLTVRAMRINDMKAVRVGLNAQRQSIEMFTDVIDKMVRRREAALRRAKKSTRRSRPKS